MLGHINQLQESVVTLQAVQRQIDISVQVMVAIRNISEGRVSWRDQSAERRLNAIHALSDLMHNFVPGDPAALSVVRSQFLTQQARSPEAFDLCPGLLAWASEGEDEGGLLP